MDLLNALVDKLRDQPGILVASLLAVVIVGAIAGTVLVSAFTFRISATEDIGNKRIQILEEKIEAIAAERHADKKLTTTMMRRLSLTINGLHVGMSSYLDTLTVIQKEIVPSRLSHLSGSQDASVYLHRLSNNSIAFASGLRLALREIEVLQEDAASNREASTNPLLSSTPTWAKILLLVVIILGVISITVVVARRWQPSEDRLRTLLRQVPQIPFFFLVDEQGMVSRNGEAQLDQATQEKYERSLKEVDRTLANDLGSSDTYFNRGTILLHLGRHEEAIQDFDESLRIKPDAAETWINRGIGLAGLKRTTEALESFDEALRIKPEDPDALSNKGALLIRTGNYDYALQVLDESLRLRPNNKAAAANRVVTLRKLSELSIPSEASEASQPVPGPPHS